MMNYNTLNYNKIYKYNITTFSLIQITYLTISKIYKYQINSNLRMWLISNQQILKQLIKIEINSSMWDSSN